MILVRLNLLHIRGIYLFRLGQRPLAIYYAIKLLKDSELNHLNDLSLLSGQFLQHYYSFVTYDINQSIIYSSKYNSHLEIINQKGTVSGLYYELVNRVVNNKSLISAKEKTNYEKMILGMRESIYPGQANVNIQRIYSNIYFYFLLTKQ